MSKLPNMGNMWDAITKRTAQYDPDNAYSINYMWGTTGIGVNIGKVTEALGEDAPIDSWDLVFKPENMEKLAGCGVHFLDAPAEMIPAALKYIGEDPDSHDPDVIAKAEAVFMAVRPYIQKFNSSEYINGLANGDICVAVGWSGDIIQAQTRAAEADKGVDVAYVIPEEGAPMWFDMLAIPKDARNVDNAYLFLDYLMRPEVMAGIQNYVAYASGNQAALPYVDTEILEDPGIYPSEEVQDKLYPLAVLPPEVDRLFNRHWTTLKTGQ
jgi:putrescine transport system substrate-binding protein